MAKHSKKRKSKSKSQPYRKTKKRSAPVYKKKKYYRKKSYKNRGRGGGFGGVNGQFLTKGVGTAVNSGIADKVNDINTWSRVLNTRLSRIGYKITPTGWMSLLRYLVGGGALIDPANGNWTGPVAAIGNAAAIQAAVEALALISIRGNPKGRSITLASYEIGLQTPAGNRSAIVIPPLV